MNAAHVAVLLAAGGSRRLGRTKQLLLRDGEPLVRRAARLALATAPARLLVVLGGDRDAVAAALSGLPCEQVDNDAWREGLSTSLGAAAASLGGHAGATLLLACDQPALEAAHLDALLAGAARAPSRCAATRHDDGAGIPAVVPAAWLRDRTGHGGDRGLGRALRALPPSQLFLLDAPALRFDVDDASDVRDAIARGWLDAGNVAP